jgi:hypothetical protein
LVSELHFKRSVSPLAALVRRGPAGQTENTKLKRIVADQVLDMSAMKELLGKHW